MVPRLGNPMKRLNRMAPKEEREKEALEKHTLLSRLFREDRLAFERKRKEMIEDVIHAAKSEELKNKLRAFQESWDKKMRGAGSQHNRLILAQTFFWEHFHEVWHPSIETFNLLLKGRSDDGRKP